MPQQTSSKSKRAGRGYRVATRMLDDGRGPPLELVEAIPEARRPGAPLLLVHGAFGGAWQWSEVFLPHFARVGRPVTALSLRGHGGSLGRDTLREQGFNDYLADVRRVLVALPEPPVVAGHSLGGLLAQRLVVQERMRGLVLMASLPPEGMALLGPRLAATEPLIWLEGFLGSIAGTKQPLVAAAQDLLFSEGLPRERIARYISLMTPESPRALAEAHRPGPVFSAFLYRLPTLVLGGEADRLVRRADVMRTAFYHAATLRFLPGMGHFLMLDAGAQEAARLVGEWMDERGV